MTQLYFKFVNHFNNIDGIPTFFGLKSKLNNYQNDKKGSYIVNGLWYDLNDYYKKASGHDINDNVWTSNLSWLYMFENSNSTYTLPIAYLSVFDTQQQADNYDINNAHYYLYKIIDNTVNEKPSYGETINLTSSVNGYDLKLGENKTYYLRIDIGNPTSTVYNYPFVDYNHQPFNAYRITSKPHIYDELNDIICATDNSIYGISYAGNSTTDVSYYINLSGKTSVIKFNTNNKDYRTNYLNYNEYLSISDHKDETPPAEQKNIEYLIDYKTKHLYLTTKNSNTGLDQKLTNFKADTNYTVKYHKEENWTYSNVKLTNNGKNYLVNNYNGTFKLYVNSADAANGSIFQFTATETDKTPKPVQYSKINLLSENVTVSPDQVELNKPTTIIITADSNHVLTPKDNLNVNIANAYYQYGSNGNLNYNFYLSSDHKSATTNVNPSTTDPINVSCVTKISNQPETDRKNIPIKLILTNCKADITELPENTKEEWNAGNLIRKTVTLTADDGYIFDKDIIYYSYAPNDSVYVKNTAKATNENTISFDMLAGAYDDLQHQQHEPEIIAVANPEKEDISTGLDSIHIYHMRNAELDNLSNKLIKYFQTTANDSEIEDKIQNYDFTRFINQVYRLPFSIPSSIESDTTKVSAGLFNLNMNTKTIKVNYYDIDIGTIKIDSKDATSYNAVKATLYLPFISSIQLDINDIIGYTISITYRINLLNGMNTLIVKNENGLIYNQNVNVATNLQLFGAYYDKNVSSLNSVLNNNLRQAYIVIERKTPITNLLTYPTNEHGLVSDYKGLTKFVNTQLHLDATFQEKQEILAQLQQGVFIK